MNDSDPLTCLQFSNFLTYSSKKWNITKHLSLHTQSIPVFSNLQYILRIVFLICQSRDQLFFINFVLMKSQLMKRLITTVALGTKFGTEHSIAMISDVTFRMNATSQHLYIAFLLNITYSKSILSVVNRREFSSSTRFDVACKLATHLYSGLH